MNLTERYLQAVKFWLPKDQKDDIIAELSEDIHTQIEEQESILGHTLTETEIEAILKQRGRPFMVANRFLPQQSLIGPLLYPMYLFVLKIQAACYAAAWLITLFTGTGASSKIFQMAFASMAGATIVFAFLDRLQGKQNFFEDWSPSRLPALRNPRLIPRFSSLFELAVYLVVLVWWVTGASSRVVTPYPGVQVTLSALWPWFFWGYLAVMLATISLSCVNLMHPYWTSTRATIRLMTDAIGGALFCWLMQTSILTGISVTSLPPARAVEFTNTINFWMAKAFPWTILTVLIILASDIYRLARLKNTKTQIPTQALA